MPGLLGYFAPSTKIEKTQILERMAQALEPAEHFRRDYFIAEGAALGRVTTGILNPEAQPVWDDAKSVCIFMEGELFNSRELAARLPAGVLPPDVAVDSRLILELYKHDGVSSFSELNGAFVVAIWDRDQDRLVLANDRLGLYPLYLYESRSGFAFASGLRALLEVPGIAKKIDHTAIAEFLTFDHVLGSRTFLEDFKRVDQGTIITYQNGAVENHRYWRPTFPDHYTRYKDREVIHRFTDLMRQSVQRQVMGAVPGGLLLSGGMDSRMLLGFMVEGQSRPSGLVTFSWGIPGCDDARYAAESARLAGTEHHFFELEPDWLCRQAEECVRISDGMSNIVNMHALATLEQQVNYAQVLYKGFLGDAMFGFGIRPRYWAKYSEEDEFHTHLDAYRDYDVLTFDLPRHEQVFNETFNAELGESIIADYRTVMDESGSDDLADQRIYIDLTQRVPRMTLNGIEAVRSRAAVRLPFADNDLLDFSLELVPGLRLGRSVMVQAFIEALPRYAQIPLASTGLPLKSCARDVAMRGAKLARWHLRSRGFEWLAGPERRPYKDYDTWFRTVMRDWIQEMLLSEQSLGRGYMRPEVIRDLVEDHMQGSNHAVKLGALLSVELWHRMYID